MNKTQLNDLIKKSLHEKLLEAVQDKKNSSKMLLEMAKIGTVSIKNTKYVIAIWDDSQNDRPLAPHVHIWRADDAKNNYQNFNFELSLVKLLVEDKWFLLRKKDFLRRNPIDVFSTDDWTPHTNLLKALKTALFQPYVAAGSLHLIDRLDHIIYTWNTERDQNAVMQGRNPLYEFIKSKNLEIHPNYQKYFQYWIDKDNSMKNTSK